MKNIFSINQQVRPNMQHLEEEGEEQNKAAIVHQVHTRPEKSDQRRKSQ